MDDEKSGYTHEKINHKLEYVHINPDESKIHTNLIESIWRPFKDFFRRRKLQQQLFFFHLKEYEWRKRVQNENKQHFLVLIEAIKLKYKSSLILVKPMEENESILGDSPIYPPE